MNKVCEKAVTYGTGTLTDSELVSAVLGMNTDKANELVKNGLADGLMASPRMECLLELSRRIATEKARERLRFTRADDIAAYYMEKLRFEKREQVWLMCLNAKGKLLCEKMISAGTVDASLVSPREVLIEALKCEAVRMIMVHNHPSGDPAPSKQDKEITRELKTVGEYIGIPLLDHIIVGDGRYYSFAGEDDL